MALYTKLSYGEIAHLVRSFGMKPPKKIRGILAGTVNTYYELSYPGKKYFLKIDEIASIPRLERELEILNFLAGRTKALGFETPTPLPATNGKFYIPFRKKFALVFPKIKGRSFGVKNLNPNHLRQAGKALADLHLETKSLRRRPHRFDLAGQKAVFSQIHGKLKKKYPKVAKEIKHRLSWLEKNRPRGLPTGLIHADLFPENILFHKNRVKGILDFEAAGSGPFMFDTATAIHALCNNGKTLAPSKARAFLTGYESARKLAKSEKKYFGYFLCESAERFLLTRLKDFDLKEGIVPAKPFKDYREYLMRFSEIPAFVKKLFPDAVDHVFDE